MQKTIVLLLLAAVIGRIPGHAQKKISRQEAVGDIDSLVSLIEEVEVDPVHASAERAFLFGG